jgi:hypothetical protein
MRAKSYSHHEKTAANDQRVLAAGKGVSDKTSRKREVDGPSLAIARRSVRKMATNDTRSGVITLPPIRCEQLERRFSHMSGQN